VGDSWIADLEALGIKQNRGSFRKVCPGTELLGGGLGQVNRHGCEPAGGMDYIAGWYLLRFFAFRQVI
jgi:hypothetical protein